MSPSVTQSFRIRSFVPRNGRETSGRKSAYDQLWPAFGLSVADGQLNFDELFGRQAPCVLEVGFGSGQSLIALAQQAPEINFIGVETYRPGIGALLMGIKKHALTNIRIFQADAIDVLEKCIPNSSLTAVQLFFPDPWPKRRHHARRLIQPNWVKLFAEKLLSEGSFYLATDWEDYAIHMLRVLEDCEYLKNTMNQREFAPRSAHRPIITKFENRALQAGRNIWDLHFKKL